MQMPVANFPVVHEGPVFVGIRMTVHARDSGPGGRPDMREKQIALDVLTDFSQIFIVPCGQNVFE